MAGCVTSALTPPVEAPGALLQFVDSISPGTDSLFYLNLKLPVIVGLWKLGRAVAAKQALVSYICIRVRAGVCTTLLVAS